MTKAALLAATTVLFLAAIQGADGFLHGTTPYGGSKNQGTLFRIDPRTDTLKELYAFTGETVGTKLFAGLRQASDIVDPRIAIYGFAFLVAGMSVTLGNRLQRALRERDALLRELEARVDKRTHALSEAYRDMRDLARHDGLTQVMNRRAIHDRAECELARSRRYQLPLTIALIDIDHFKTVNDTYGHAAGDQVLVQVSARLTNTVRASDDVGRWGGEEFLVLMPGTGRRDAAAAGERLRTVVAALPMSIAENVPQNVTVSVGLIAVDGTGSASLDLDALIRCADEAMYRAKAEGRNTVRVADLPLMEQPR